LDDARALCADFLLRWPGLAELGAAPAPAAGRGRFLGGNLDDVGATGRCRFNEVTKNRVRQAMKPPAAHDFFVLMNKAACQANRVKPGKPGRPTPTLTTPTYRYA